MRPADEAELAEALRSASAPLHVRGGGTRASPARDGAEALLTAGLGGVVLHEPGAMTLVARAGTPLDEVTAVLAAEGQRLPFEPPDLRGLLGRDGVSTIGGVVAANASGPARVRLGAARDHLLGMRLVDGEGRVIRNGGRVMKNVTGYDLARLMAGSQGRLGVLTEVSLRVMPRPETEVTLCRRGLSPAAAVSAMARALASPFEVTGAAHDPRDGGRTFLRIEGFAASVAYRTGLIEAILRGDPAPSDIERIEAAASSRVWADLGGVAAFAGREGDVWRLSVVPGDAAGLVARLPDGACWLMDWGGGLVWALCAEGTDLRAVLRPYTGHATLVRAALSTIAALGMEEPRAPAVAALTAGLRAKFDPRGILAGAG
ncbi:MAG: FAD-binding protein [Rubellimicrobium sp.]|nr:FAD-binding protein [Rubellimicrobium sp.]